MLGHGCDGMHNLDGKLYLQSWGRDRDHGIVWKVELADEDAIF